MTPRCCFFVNPLARHGRGIERLEAVLRRAPHAVRAGAETAVIGDVDIRAALTALPSSTWPVAVGGDGTANLMVQSLREAGLGRRPFGVLPLGSGNAFAHSIGLGSVRRALMALEHGRPQPLDIMVSDHPTTPVALVSMSAGFESQFLGEMSVHETWRRWSRLVPGLLRHVRARRNDVGLVGDGDALVAPGETVYNVGLYNLPCYAFGKVMWPDAVRDDGRAEAVMFSTARSYWKALALGVPMPGDRGGSDPRWRRWRTAHFESPVAFQIDGEVVPGGRYEVRVEPRAINVITL